MSLLRRDIRDGEGGVRSNMPGGEEKNLGWKKYRQKQLFALFFFSRHFYFSRASRLCPSSKASKKTSNERDSSVWHYTDSPSSPSKIETNVLNLQEKFIPLNAT